MRGMVKWVVLLALLVGAANAACAGVEPSPFLPGTNVLNSVVDVLWQVDQHLQDVLTPSDPTHPPEPGIQQLNALTKELQVENGRVMAVLAMVSTETETPPDEFLQALWDVRTGAVGDPELGVAGIAGDTGFTPRSEPPGDDDPVGQALYRVYQAALDIGATVDGYLYPAGTS